MTPWYRFLTDLGDRSVETVIIYIRRAALAIRANFFFIARAETDAPLADFQCKSHSSSGYKKNVLLPEQKSNDGNVHARPVGDVFSEHMST